MKNKYYLLIIVVLAFFTMGNTRASRYTENLEREYRISTSVHENKYIVRNIGILNNDK